MYALVPLTLALSPSAVPIIVAYVLAGIGIEVFNVPWFTAAQREVPQDRLARVSSLDFVISYGMAPLGLALLTPAIRVGGTVPVLVACAIACALGCLLAAMTPSARELSTDC